jgi:hypothetical protein
MRHKLNHASSALDRGQFVRSTDLVNFHTDLHGDDDDSKTNPNPDTPSCPVGDISPSCEGNVIITNPNNTDDDSDTDDSDAIWSDSQGFQGVVGLASGALGRLGRDKIYGIPFFQSAQLLQGITFSAEFESKRSAKGIPEPPRINASLNDAEAILQLKRTTFTIASEGIGNAISFLKTNFSTINKVESLKGNSYANFDGVTGFTEQTLQSLVDAAGTTRGYKNFFTQKHFFFDLTRSATRFDGSQGMTTGDRIVSAFLKIPVKDQFAPRNQYHGLNNSSLSTQGRTKTIGRKFEVIRSRNDYGFGNSFGLTGFTGSGGFTSFGTFAGSITPDVDADIRTVTLVDQDLNKNDLIVFDIKDHVEDALANQAGKLRFLLRPTGSEFTTDGISSGGLETTGAGPTPGGVDGHGFEMYSSGTLKPKIDIKFTPKINSGMTRGFSF